MSEAGAEQHRDEQEWQRAWLPRMRRLQHESPEKYLPRAGMEVAGYRLETRLGTGGQGTVFRARREGRLFAVKFIFLPRAPHWAWRELDVMVKLWRAGGLPLEGHGLWPAQKPLFLLLVTPFVRGLPLDVWVQVHNANARQVAELVREAARQLQVVHAAGVVHRDVKGANLLVYGEGRLVLVDFGVATYEGAPVVTGPMPPGTWPYLGPRVWRAWRGEEQSRASPGDDVWALGVELYQLLTGRLPFQGREGTLVHAILHEEPKPPHESNPRVPRALGEVCQRMLRKQPGEGYEDAREVEAALGEVLKQKDETWEVPLMEAPGPDSATTERQKDAPPTPSTEATSTPGPEPTPAAEPEPPSAPTPDASASRSRVLWAVIAVVVLVLGLGVWLAVRPPPRTSEPTTPPEGTPGATLPPEFHPITLKPGGQEVAAPRKRPEGDGGAAPPAAATPAPVARATPPKDTRVKTPAKAPAPQQQHKPQPQETSSPAARVGAVVLGCTLATGCPSSTTTPLVRPTPPPEAECPEGSAQIMKELGLLRRGTSGRVDSLGDDDDGYIIVRPGPMTMRLTGDDYWGKLPEGTLFSGELLFGERVQARFTQAHTPDGHTYAVCLELRSGPKWGWEKEPGSGQGTARVLSGGFLEPVERFGEAWRYKDREKR
jgi:serine/threonine-protein kinase